MTVKGIWANALGNFRGTERTLINFMYGKYVVVDTSSWVHNGDRKQDIQYARTSNPKYPHPALISMFAARCHALKALNIHPIFVFDGKPPPLKSTTNRIRKKKSDDARKKYDDIMAEVKDGKEVTDDLREQLLKLRRDKARPIAHEYASLSKWMECNDIEYVQAPFEADAQMKQLILEGRASGAITEDGDMVVFGVPHILTHLKFDLLAPENSDCQHFDIEKLKAGEYESPIAVGKRVEYLAVISCLLGNDYIDNIPGVGPAKVFGTSKNAKNQLAIIDTYINHVMVCKNKTEQEWLQEYETKYNRKKDEGNTNDANESDDDDDNDDDDIDDESGDNDDDQLVAKAWTPEYFICVKNAIIHYPIFAKNPVTGEVTLKPLNPLPVGTDWGSYIGFDKPPEEYFIGNNGYKEYYNMTIVGSKEQPRDKLLGPRYTADDNPRVDTENLIPLFGKLDFTADPIDVQPPSVLRAYLLSHGVAFPNNIHADKLREAAHRMGSANRTILTPDLVPLADSWVGLEVLHDETLGDKYDDWVSVCYLFLLIFHCFSPVSFFI